MARSDDQILCKTPRVKEIELNDGNLIPRIGFGTWFKDDPITIINIIERTIRNGYRLIDCVHTYEPYIGRAIENVIKDKIVKRDELYIIVKLPNTEHEKEKVPIALKNKLNLLNLTYVDLFLMTWPFAHDGDIDYLETWSAMEECRKRGLTNSIGVCNFNLKQLERFYVIHSRPPSVLQTEVHVNFIPWDILDFCDYRNIIIIAHSPFGVSKSGSSVSANLQDPVITEIANRLKVTNHQVALRFLVDLHIIPIPRSSSQEHQHENLNVFNFRLTASDKRALRNCNRMIRTFTADEYENLKEYPFNKD